MFFPLRTDRPLRNTPYMNYFLIVANVAVFLAELAHPALQSQFELDPRHPMLWKYLTYAFIHANWMHIIGNMLFLYIFGNNVNDKMGHLGYLAFYLAGGVFAGIAYVLTSAGEPVVGASGAIAAVTGAYLVLFPRSNITVVYFFWLIGQVEIPSLWFIGFFFAYDLVLNFAHDSNVAHTAHIGGTLFGFFVCLIMLFSHLLPRDQYDVVALVQRWNKRRQYKDMVSKGYNPFAYGIDDASARTPRSRSGAPIPDPREQDILQLRAAISDALSSQALDQAADLYLRLLAIDPNQVMSRQAQLDIGNQFASRQQYAEAADAYEKFLNVYPGVDQSSHIQLMLGLIYSRYLHRYAQARDHLNKVLERVHGDREIQLAREELARIPGG